MTEGWMGPMLDLNEVRMFVQVVRARSFAAAARRLNVPPNTLSRRIRQLEATLETRLMQRSTRKLTLTAAGQAFFERCAAAVDGVLAAGKELLDGSQKPSGSLRIAAPADFLDLFHTDWLVEFLALYPLVRLEFVLSDTRADLINEGIDVAFRGGTLDAQQVFRRISSQSSNLVASPGYVAARGMPRKLADLATHDCLTITGAQKPVKWTLQGPDGDHEITVSGRLSSNSARSLTRFCVAGLGIALLPSLLILRELQTGQLVRVLPDHRRDGADFNIVLPSHDQIPTAVLAFVDFATDRLQRLEAADDAVLG
jgi:DNA-binding transcriptional LysR family regulator